MSSKSFYMSAHQVFEDGSLVPLRSFLPHRYSFSLSFHIYPGVWTSPEMPSEHPPDCLLFFKLVCIGVYLFTMLCWFLLYSKASQPYVRMHPLILGFPSHVGQPAFSGSGVR